MPRKLTSSQLSDYNREYYERNRERILKKRAQHYIDHQVEVRAYMKEYYKRNKEAIKAYEREKYHYLKKRA